MNEYEKPYKILFNAITDALKEKELESVRGLLILAQIEAEEAFLRFEEEKTKSEG